MGSFEEDKDIIRQNLECVTERPDAVFGIRMLMEDKCEMPDRETVQDVMDRHLGRSECFCYDAQVIGFSPVSTVFILQKRIKIYHRSY